jgi:hypothetical protein
MEVRLASGEPHDFQEPKSWERATMADFRFQVGQLVRLMAAKALDAPDLYQVVLILAATPSDDVQYRLRGIHVPNERVVRDHQISPATIIRAHESEPQFPFVPPESAAGTRLCPPLEGRP